MFPDESVGRPNLAVIQAVILRQSYLWLKPKLGFPIRVMDMHVWPGPFSRKEKEPESVLAEDRRAHERSSGNERFSARPAIVIPTTPVLPAPRSTYG